MEKLLEKATPLGEDQNGSKDKKWVDLPKGVSLGDLSRLCYPIFQPAQGYETANSIVIINPFF